MTNAFFAGVAPTRTIHVTVGTGAGDGSAQNPFHSIQEAVNAAQPGTMIAVAGGTYNENIKIAHNRGGSDGAPIWLVSADGDGAAKIVAPSNEKPAIQALGVDNYVIKGFALSGGYDGIQFGQSGRDFTNLVQNVALVSNTITGVQHDGIKVGQADNVFVLGNRISAVATEEGIDFVAVTNAVIAGNEVSGIGGSSAAIFAKGGSTHIDIIGNYVHGAGGDGISAGGWTDASSFKPGYRTYEGDDIRILGNRVEAVGKHPVSVRGAHDVTIQLNQLEASDKYRDAVYVSTGNPRAEAVVKTSNVEAVHNIVTNATKFYTIDAGNGTNVRQSANDDGSVSDADLSHVLDGMWTSLDAIARAVNVGASGIAYSLLRNLPSPPTDVGGAVHGEPTPNDGHSAVTHLVGTRGNDRLVGDAGSNIIDGGLGKDVLVGGGGADSFVFSTALRASNVDTIKDFSVVDDTIWLDRDVFRKVGPAGELGVDAFHSSTSGKAHDASDRIIYNTKTGDLFYDADGSGSKAAIKFAHLEPGLALTHADFLIIA